jgi:hypothetical protein
LTLVDSLTFAFRYADGKTLKGIGTCNGQRARALGEVRDALELQNPVCRSRVVQSQLPFEPFENNSKGIKKELLGSFRVSLGDGCLNEVLKRSQRGGVDVQQRRRVQLGSGVEEGRSSEATERLK